MSQHHILAILDPRHAHARALCIHADRHEAVGDAVHFFRGTRMVYALPASHVRQLRAFDDERSARRARDTFLQQRAGAATFDVDEIAVAPRRQRAGRSGGATNVPAEGVVAVVGGERVVRRRPREA